MGLSLHTHLYKNEIPYTIEETESPRADQLTDKPPLKQTIIALIFVAGTVG